MSHVNHRPYVLLLNAYVKVTANGMETECTVGLDSGSQVNRITGWIVVRLGLPVRVHLNQTEQFYPILQLIWKQLFCTNNYSSTCSSRPSIMWR